MGLRSENRTGRLIRVQQALQLGDQFGSGGGFADKSIGAQKPDGRFRLRCRLLHAQEENLGGGRDTPNLKGGLYAIHYRHINIEKNDFRIERLYLVERLPAIGSFTADAQSVRIQQFAHGAARDPVIIDKKNSGRKSPFSHGPLFRHADSIQH